MQLINHPNGGNDPKPEDDRFWEKALELEMPLSPHMMFGGILNIGAPRHDTALWPAEAGMTQHAGGPGPATTMAQLIVARTFERIPELRFYFAEINAAIFPASLYYMDRDYLEYNSWFQLDLPKMPSQYLRDHAIYGMVREPLAVKMGQALPVEMPLELFWWGSDFPHSVGTFPHSRKYIEETFSDLDPRCASGSSSGTPPNTWTSTSTPTSPRRRRNNCSDSRSKTSRRTPQDRRGGLAQPLFRRG